MLASSAVAVLLCAAGSAQAVTVYGLQGQLQQTLAPDGATSVVTAITAGFTAAAYNNVVLQAPPIPSPPPPTQFGLSLQASANNVANLSIAQSGAFLGFSVEFSVVNQVGQSWLECVRA